MKKTRQKSNTALFAFGTMVLLAFSLIAGVGVARMAPKNEAAKQRASVVQSELESLKNSQESLEEEIEYTSTQFGQETLLRQKYGVGKPGERSLVLYDTPQFEITSEEPKEPGFFKRIWRSIFE
jgi:cell division protein FtsB